MQQKPVCAGNPVCKISEITAKHAMAFMRNDFIPSGEAGKGYRAPTSSSLFAPCP
jgi:hypothetical protein